MKEFKGTPGSWVVDGDYDVTTEDGTVVSWAAEGVFEHDEIIANANLIAAAPELLEALQQLLEDVCSNNDSVLGYRVAEARSAISKALGEE